MFYAICFKRDAHNQARLLDAFVAKLDAKTEVEAKVEVEALLSSESDTPPNGILVGHITSSVTIVSSAPVDVSPKVEEIKKAKEDAERIIKVAEIEAQAAALGYDLVEAAKVVETQRALR